MTQTVKTFTKDPNSVLDYTLDWSSWLETSDTISSASWSASGVTVDSENNTTTTATVFVSGGALNVDSVITCQIVTSGGRTDERSIAIQIRDL